MLRTAWDSVVLLDRHSARLINDEARLKSDYDNSVSALVASS